MSYPTEDLNGQAGLACDADEPACPPLEVLDKMNALRNAVLFARDNWAQLRRGKATTHLTKAANAMLRDIEAFSEELKRQGI